MIRCSARPSALGLATDCTTSLRSGRLGMYNAVTARPVSVIRMQVHRPTALELEVIIVPALEHAPCLVVRDELQSFEEIIRRVGSAVIAPTEWTAGRERSNSIGLLKIIETSSYRRDLRHWTDSHTHSIRKAPE